MKMPYDNILFAVAAFITVALALPVGIVLWSMVIERLAHSCP